MEVYETSNHSIADDEYSSYNEFITRIVKDIFSFDDMRRKRTIDHYYFPHATFTSPLLKTQGTHNIKHVLLVWKTFNKEPPKIDNICFNGKTCIVFLTQIICPRMFPWIKIELPVSIILEFKETDKESDLYKIDSHHEHWTVEGLLNTVPCLSYWYDRIIRTMVGKLLSTTGEAVYTATETASLLISRSKEIEETRKRLEQDKDFEIMMLKITEESQ